MIIIEMDQLKNIIVSKDLLLNFFICFAKFEFALKISGFAKGDQSQVRPDWDGYAKSIKDIFDEKKSSILVEAVNYFRLNPPWKQVIINGSVAWNSTASNNNKSEIEKTLILIRRVRNNLFHGGKFSNEAFEDTERTTHLLEKSLIILEECLNLSPNVMQHFNEATI
jgi:hypothetical protein